MRGFRSRIISRTSWITRLFPTLGAFLFWRLWPYLVARKTQVYYFLYTGRYIPPDRMKQFRKDLAMITRDITKPEETRK